MDARNHGSLSLARCDAVTTILVKSLSCHIARKKLLIKFKFGMRSGSRTIETTPKIIH